MKKCLNINLSELSSTQILQAGFSFLETADDIVTSPSCLYCNTIIFVLRGSVEIRSRTLPTKSVGEQHFCCLQMQESYTCTFAPHSKIVVFTFGIPLINDGNILHIPLDKLPVIGKSHMVELNIVEPLSTFLMLILQYLEKKYDNYKLYNTKREELFYLLQKIYSKEQMGYFYNLLSDSQLNFEKKVVEKIKTIKTVKDLADIQGCGEAAFRSKFTKTYGIPPYHWFLQVKAKVILSELIIYKHDFKTIIDQFNFTSHSHFHKFCLEQYKIKPEELGKILNI